MKTTNIILSLFLSLLFFSCSKSDDEEYFEEYFDLSIYTYVPDDHFEQLLIDIGYDDKLDNHVLTNNIRNVKGLSNTRPSSYGFVSYGINDFTGLEDFIGLESLSLIGTNLTSLDLSKNIALNNLACFDNSLIDLNISQNIELEYLICWGSLNSLDVSKNTNLKELNCNSNRLTSLDVSNNINLTSLICRHNSSLYCVQVNEKQLNNNILNTWFKPDNTVYSLDCNY